MVLTVASDAEDLTLDLPVDVQLAEVVMTVLGQCKQDPLEGTILEQNTNGEIALIRVIAEHAQDFLFDRISEGLIRVGSLALILRKFVMLAPLLGRHVEVRQDVAMGHHERLVIQKDLLVRVQYSFVFLVAEECHLIFIKRRHHGQVFE